MFLPRKFRKAHYDSMKQSPDFQLSYPLSLYRLPPSIAISKVSYSSTLQKHFLNSLTVP